MNTNTDEDNLNIDDKNRLNNKVELATKCWAEQQEIIHFADSKANFNLVVCTALFASFGIGSGTIGAGIKESDLTLQFLLIIFGLLAFIFIVFSFLSSLWVVLPRFGSYNSNHSPKPIPYFHYIAKKIKTKKELEKEIMDLTQLDLLKIRIDQIFELARIANTKMVWTTRSVKLTFVSVLSSSIFFILIIIAISNSS